jgi:hypothetical protein
MCWVGGEGGAVSEPITLEAIRRLRKLDRVERVVERVEEGISVLCVIGHCFTLDDYDAIISTKWQVLDEYPGEFFDISIQDAITPLGEQAG